MARKGLIPYLGGLIWGEAKAPKLGRGSGSQDSNTAKNESYGSMDKNYRVFRRDSIVRTCLLANAYFSTMAGGFDTVLEPTDQTLGDAAKEALLKRYAPVKDAVDAANKRVNLDQVLFAAQLKRSIYGKAAFEIVRRPDESPSWLLPLSSANVKPKIGADWTLEGYTYNAMKELTYRPGEVLYFANLSLDADREGISDIEPIHVQSDARYEVLQNDFAEIVRTMWAPTVYVQADTSGLSDDDATSLLDDLTSEMRSGKSVAVNQSVTATVIDRRADIAGLQAILQSLKEEIIGNFGVPRLLLGQPIENRATAFAELDAYRDGAIAFRQRNLKRDIEAQWYDPLAKLYAEKLLKVRVEDDAEPEVRLKHVWRKVQARDLLEASQEVANLWGGGLGPLAPGRLDKVWELMGWDPADAKRTGGET